MRYMRIYAAPDGGSRLEDVEVSMSEDILAGNVPRMRHSAPIPVTSVLFVEHLPGAERPWEWHRAPRRQLVIPLRGRLLAEDTVGAGHRTVPLTGDFRFVTIPLAE